MAHLEIGLYYYIDDETNKRVYDVEEMQREFDEKIKALQQLEEVLN